MKIFYTDRAKIEVEVAFSFYENQKHGLGEEFLTALEKSFETIKTFPESSQIIYHNFRRFVVRKFPYSIFYTIEEKIIVVHAVFYNRRNPKDQP